MIRLATPFALFIAALPLAAAAQQAAPTPTPPASPAPANPPGKVTLTPIDKPPFELKPPMTAAEKSKQAREHAQKRHDELKERWAKGYPVEGKPPIPLSFEEPIKSLGRVSDDGKIDVAFKFRNTSSQTVKIKPPKAGCGCTVANLAKDTYAPGEEGTIGATYDPKGRHGLEFKDIDISIDEPGAPNMKVGFLVDTLPRVVTDPKAAMIGETRKGAANKSMISVIGREPGFDVTGVTLADPNAPFTITRLGSAEETDDNGDKVTRVNFEAALKPGQVVGPYATTINFATNDAKRPSVAAPVNAMVVGDLKASPERVFVVAEAGSLFQREVILSDRNNRPFNILGVQTDGLSAGFTPILDVKARDTTGRPGEIVAYTLIIAGALPAPVSGGGGASGKIVVLTDLPDQPRMEIPIQGVIASATPRVQPQPVPAKPQQ